MVHNLLRIVSGWTKARVELSKRTPATILIRKLIDGSLPRSMTAQSRRAKVVAVEVWLCILCRRMIAFKNKLTILEHGSLQQSCMYYTYDQILESMGDGPDLQ